MSYRTSPSDSTGMPSGVPHIVVNEAAERFSFYGMKAVLAVFMVKYLHLMNDEVGKAMTDASATEYIHNWIFWVYITPFIGALIADVFFGKYRTIITLSLVYCLGHAALAFMGVQGEARWWLTTGLALIAIGSGGIKPCVSAHVGDQFGKSNAHLLPKVFNWFYFSINLGAMVSMMLTPWLMEWYGPHLAFGIPGVLMAFATLIFWMGRKTFIHVPAGGQRFLEDINKRDTWKIILKLLPLYVFLAMFWALFDQTGSTWIFQAQDMDRKFLGIDWLPSQVQSLNSLFVLSFIPIFAYLLYPLVSKVWKLTPLRKISIGLFIMAASFALVADVQSRIDAGNAPNIGWQVLAYALLTASEVMVSIVALEFAYTQSPRTMKSLVMCFYLGAVAFGNLFTAQINNYIQIPSVSLEEGKPHAGYDEKLNTADDLKLVEDKKLEITEIESPARSQLKQATKIIEAHFLKHQSMASNDELDTELSAIKDPWGTPLRYTLMNSRTARVSSDGPDKTANTQWDLGIKLTLPEEKKNPEKSWTDALHPETP
ncbi:MAG: POT family MFS transporter, partial [Akkermansiaceae bacterium]